MPTREHRSDWWNFRDRELRGHASLWADWKNRSTAPGVVWAHDFTDPEEARAWRYASSDSLFPTRPSHWQDIEIDPSVPAPGNSRSLVHRIIGTTLAQPISSDATRVYLTNISEFPDPATVGVYGAERTSVLMGLSGDRSEAVTVTAKGANYLEIARGSNAQAHAAGVPFSVDRRNSWNRPLGAFGSPKNGKLTADIGISNGSRDRSSDWRYQHNQFRGAWWGHPDYEALYDARWPVSGFDTGSWHSYTDTFEGNEFWIQYRQRISGSRFAAKMPRGKLNYIQNVSTTTAQQLYFLIKPDIGRRLYMEHDGQGAYGNVDVPLAEWFIEPDTWETYMIHVRPGHRLVADSTLEVLAAHEGDRSWTTLYNSSTFSIHFYPASANHSECEAYNNFQPRNNPNHYQGSSGGGANPLTNYVAYTQIILSRNPIPLPA